MESQIKIFDLKFKTELIPEFAIFRIEEDDVSLFITDKIKNSFGSSQYNRCCVY